MATKGCAFADALGKIHSRMGGQQVDPTNAIANNGIRATREFRANRKGPRLQFVFGVMNAFIYCGVHPPRFPEMLQVVERALQAAHRFRSLSAGAAEHSQGVCFSFWASPRNGKAIIMASVAAAARADCDLLPTLATQNPATYRLMMVLKERTPPLHVSEKVMRR